MERYLESGVWDDKKVELKRHKPPRPLEPPTPERQRELMGLIAQAYCSKENGPKLMDPVLNFEIARIIYTAEQEKPEPVPKANLGYATTLELIEELKSRWIVDCERNCRTADDPHYGQGSGQ